MLLLQGLRQSAGVLPSSSRQILPELTLRIFDEYPYKEENKPGTGSVVSPDQALPAIVSAPSTAGRAVHRAAPAPARASWSWRDTSQLLQATGEPRGVASARGHPQAGRPCRTGSGHDPGIPSTHDSAVLSSSIVTTEFQYFMRSLSA